MERPMDKLQTLPAISFEGSSNSGFQVGVNNAAVTNNFYTYATPTAPPPVDQLFNVPFSRDRDFIPRQAIFERIDGIFDLNEPVVLCGLGGTGKSQIAIEYAYRFRKRHRRSYVLWIYACQRQTIVQGLSDVARKLKIPGARGSPEESCDLVFDWLDEQVQDVGDYSDEEVDMMNGEQNNDDLNDDSKPRFLLIFDNVDSVKLLNQPLNTDEQGIDGSGKTLYDYLPKQLSSHRRLLITTRSQDVARMVNDSQPGIEVGVFSLEESLGLMQSKLKKLSVQSSEHDQQALPRLLQLLGYVPLAISQAAAFMVRNKTSISQYAVKLGEGDQQLVNYIGEELQDSRRARGWPNSVYRTWKISFDMIQAESDYAVEVLSVFSMLDSQKIPRRLFDDSVNDSASTLSGGIHMSDENVAMALGTLLSYSLIVIQENQNLLSIHPLVQACVRQWLRQKVQYRRYVTLSMSLLADKFPEGTFGTWDECKLLIPHASIILQRQEQLVHEQLKGGTDKLTDQETIIRLLDNMTMFEWCTGYYSNGLQHAEAAHNLSLQLFGNEAKRTQDCLNMIGLLLINLCRFKEAEHVFRKVIEVFRALEGEESWSTLMAWNNLADAILLQGRYDEAYEIHSKVLQVRSRTLGTDHVSTLLSMYNVAEVLRQQGKYQEAEQLCKEAVDMQSKCIGVDDPETLVSMHCLAEILRQQQRFVEAEALHREILERREHVEGKEHPDTIKSYWCLARTLVEDRKDIEALKLFDVAVDAFNALLGPSHPDTVTCAKQRDEWRLILATQSPTEAFNDALKRFEWPAKAFQVHRSATL